MQIVTIHAIGNGVDPRLEEIKILVLREVFSREYVPKSGSSWKESAWMELLPY